jgi:hypothetical protein
MAQPDWQERYLALVPEKLTAADAKVLLDLIEEDTGRFVQALVDLAEAGEGAKE